MFFKDIGLCPSNASCCSSARNYKSAILLKGWTSKFWVRSFLFFGKVYIFAPLFQNRVVLI